MSDFTIFFGVSHAIT